MTQPITEQKIVNVIRGLRKLIECEGVAAHQKVTLESAMVAAQEIYTEFLVKEYEASVKSPLDR